MTIKEVARLAGVSPAAVSRYLNGGPLSKDKKERVARAIEETGYRPNLMAKTMRTGRVRQIGIIVPRIYSESVNLLMEGITEELLLPDGPGLLGHEQRQRTSVSGHYAEQPGGRDHPHGHHAHRHKEKFAGKLQRAAGDHRSEF